MAEITWIKIATNMFDDEKIKLIHNMPDGDAIIVVWVRLLTLAGKTNDGGYIYLSEGMPYTDEMMACIFNTPLPIVRLAMDTLIRMRMVEADSKGMYLVNWDKHQNIEGLDRIREQNRIRKQKQRLKPQLTKIESRDGHVTVTKCHGIDIEEDVEEEINNIATSGKAESDITERIFEFYCETLGVKRRLTKQRIAKITARLKQFSEEELKQAIVNLAADDFIMGRAEGGKFYAELEYVFRSTEKTEIWVNKNTVKAKVVDIQTKASKEINEKYGAIAEMGKGMNP